MNFKSVVAGLSVLACCLGNAAPAQAWSKQGEFNRFWNNNIHPLVQEVNSHIDSGDVAAECEATWELWALFDRYEWDYGSVRRWDKDLDQVMTVNEKNVDWCGEWKAEQDRIRRANQPKPEPTESTMSDAEAAALAGMIFGGGNIFGGGGGLTEMEARRQCHGNVYLQENNSITMSRFSWVCQSTTGGRLWTRPAR